jgi:hypothetical protein
MEEVMIEWSLTDLMHLTGNELCALACRIANLLRDFEAGSVERHQALTSLENIRRVLALRKHHKLP